jgi:hypothetical protein
MNGIAGAGMIQGECQQGIGRQACAGSSQPDAGWGQTTQIS